MNEFAQQLDQLVAGELAEILVTKENFMEFRQAWLHHPAKKAIIGTAGLNGQICYRFSENEAK